MAENEIAKIIVHKCYQIHMELGSGLLESVYEEILHYELSKVNLKMERQKTIPVLNSFVTWRLCEIKLTSTI